MEQEKLFLAKIEEEIIRAAEENYTVLTRFLTPEEQQKAREILRGRVRLFESGGYAQAQRRIFAFCPEYVASEADVDFNIGVVRVIAKQSELGHRDYMGSVLGLGLKREVIGDIALAEDGAFVFCVAEMAEYISRNLDKIGRFPVKCEVPALQDVVIAPREFESLSITVASMRLDAVLAGALHQTRSKVTDLIVRGDVFVNYKETKNTSQKIAVGDMISVRRFGKFAIERSLGETKKGREKIEIKQYR